MNWALLVLSVATVARRSSCSPAYSQYDLPQRQSVGLGGYQGPPVVPVILPGGFIADTEEVARAKDLHFNAYAHAAGNVKYNAAAEEYSQPKQAYAAAAPVRQQVYQQYSKPQRQQDYNVPQHRYTGPAARTYSEPTPATYQAQPSYSPQQRYQGPPVIPVVLPNGYIAETADVEAAKQQHFQLVAQAQAAVARAQERDAKQYGYSPTRAAYRQEDDGSQYDDGSQNYNQIYQAAPKAAYSTPQRSTLREPYQGPVVLPSGHIADTAEVAAAKISHLQQLLDAAQKSLPQQRYHAVR